MNLVQSSLAERDGALHAEFGPVRLRLPDSVLAARPSLRGYVGKPVIVGLRPEDIEDAAFVPSANGSTLDVDVSLAEPMGAELIAHFPLDACRSGRRQAQPCAAATTTPTTPPRSP